MFNQPTRLLGQVQMSFPNRNRPTYSLHSRQSTLRSVARVLIVFGILAGGAIWVGEKHLPQQVGIDAPAFWLRGQSPWAPDYNRCQQCGDELIPRVDALSACRHCERCSVSYRHKSLPRTLVAQERIWK